MKSCWEDSGVFLVEIATVSGGMLAIATHPVDPGALAVDDFVSEEEEAAILGNLDSLDESASRRLLPEEMEARIASQVVADLHHLLRAISHSPAEAVRFPWRRPVVAH